MRPVTARSPAMFAQPRCEQLEERLALALFNVQNPLSFTGLNNNECVAVSDLNKDGFADAVLTNFGTDYGSGAGTTITVLYGRVSGGFNRVNLSTGGQNVSFANIADINGDGWPDAVVANANHQNTGSVSVFRNDGAGNLSLVGTPFSTFSNNPSRVQLTDLTGDGVLDAVVCSFGKNNGTGTVGNSVTIFQGNADALGKGNFTFSSNPITTLAPSVGFTPTALAVADFDGDGIKDIAAVVPIAPPDVGQPEPPGTVYIFKGTGGAAFAAPTQFASGGVLPVDIHAANLNGDSKLDLVIANAGDPNANPEFSGDAVGVLLNTSTPGNVNFGATTSILDNTYGTFAVAVDDFNLDGKADIAAVNYGGQTFSPPAFVSIYTGSGTGTFTPGSPATYDTKTNLGGGQYLAVGDFDHNSTPDLIVAHASNLVGLLLNTTVPPPVVTASSFQFERSPQKLAFTFDRNVNISLSSIALQKLPGGSAPTLTLLPFDSANHAATFQLDSLLPDGNYRATLHASGVTDSITAAPMAADYSLDFFVLGGDANRDRKVDATDLGILSLNWQQIGRTFSQGNFDYGASGKVDVNDLNILAAHWQQSLAAPVLSPAPPPVRAPRAGPVSRITDEIESPPVDLLA